MFGIRSGGMYENYYSEKTDPMLSIPLLYRRLHYFTVNNYISNNNINRDHHNVIVATNKIFLNQSKTRCM